VHRARRNCKNCGAVSTNRIASLRRPETLSAGHALPAGQSNGHGTNAADRAFGLIVLTAFHLQQNEESLMRTLTKIFLAAAVIGSSAAIPAYAQGYGPDAPPPPQYYDNPPPQYYANAPSAQYGVVDGIDYVQHGSSPSGAGAVIGGIAGGVIGHQIGSGRGNTAATIAGAIGGALVGNEVEKRHRRADEDYRIGVRMDDGSYRTFILPSTDLRIGDRVAVEGERIYRQ
jgi:outer membrane lipoprotein SlyB